MTRALCAQDGAVAVGVKDRLAPERPFPTGPGDFLAVYRWLRARGQARGGDPSRSAVAGDSSGANFDRPPGRDPKAGWCPRHGPFRDRARPLGSEGGPAAPGRRSPAAPGVDGGVGSCRVGAVPGTPRGVRPVPNVAPTKEEP